MVVLAANLLSASGRLANSDAEVMYSVTRALATSGTMDISPCTHIPGSVHCVAGTHGRHYAGLGPLPSALAVPWYMAGARVGHMAGIDPDLVAAIVVSFMNCVVGALIVVVFFRWVTTLGFDSRVALLLCLMLAFGTPLWFYSVKGFYSEPLFALLLLASFYCVSRTESRGSNLVAGVFFGLAVATRAIGLIYLPVLLIYASACNLWALSPEAPGSWSRAARPGSMRNIAFLAIGLSVSFAALGYVNFRRFGNPLYTGYHLVLPTSNSLLATPFLVGLRGLLFDGQVGLLWFSPLVILLPFAWRRFHKKHPRESVACGGMLALTLIFFSKYTSWHGGWAYGPRFFVPVLPFTILPLAYLAEELAHRRAFKRRRAVWALFAVAGIIQFLGIVPSESRFYYLAGFYERNADRPWWRDSMILADVDAFPKVLGNVEAGQASVSQMQTTYADRSRMEYSADTVGRQTQSADSYLASLPNRVNVLAPDLWLVKAWIFGARSWVVILLAGSLVACGLVAALRIALHPHAKGLPKPGRHSV